MDKNQILVLALASVPTMLTVMIGMLLDKRSFANLNSRMDSRENRMTSIENRLTNMDHKLDAFSVEAQGQ